MARVVALVLIQPEGSGVSSEYHGRGIESRWWLERWGKTIGEEEIDPGGIQSLVRQGDRRERRRRRRKMNEQRKVFTSRSIRRWPERWRLLWFRELIGERRDREGFSIKLEKALVLFSKTDRGGGGGGSGFGGSRPAVAGLVRLAVLQTGSGEIGREEELGK